MWECIAYTVYGHIANGMGSCMLSCDSMIDGYILLRVCKKILVLHYIVHKYF